MTISFFFDTETGGFPNENVPPEHPSQPPLVELGFELFRGTRMLQTMSAIIKPYNGLTISPDAARIHGISQERAQAEGVPLVAALAIFDHCLRQADEVVAHNLAFDIRMMELVYKQLGRNSGPPWPARRICTMVESTNLVKAAPGRRPGQWKWPKLAETYAFFTNKQLENAHTAAADCAAMREILHVMRERGHIEDPDRLAKAEVV
jgi:DNA polymerase III subunit epsilon